MEWQGLPADDATWEPQQFFIKRYPDFQLKDELFAKEGRDVRAQAQEQAYSWPVIMYYHRRRGPSG